jgi:YVTN family beta-propeller protein
MSTPGRLSLRQSIRKAVNRQRLRSLPWLLALASVVAATNSVRVSPTPAASVGYRVYATNERAGTVTVLEPREARAVATIPIGGRPRGIAGVAVAR